MCICRTHLKELKSLTNNQLFFSNSHTSCPPRVPPHLLLRNGSLCARTCAIMYHEVCNIRKTKMETSAHVKWIAHPQEFDWQVISVH